MRIGIDARLFGPEQGGLGRYIQQLILHLEKTPSDDEFIIFLRKNNFDSYQPTDKRFTKVLADIPWYGWEEQVKLPRLLKQQRLDLMHFPHWNVPLWYRDPFVVTIHDLLLLHYPTRRASTLGPIRYWIKNLAFRRVLKHAITGAQQIIAPSKYTAADITKQFNIPLEKIAVTYQAATPLPTPTTPPEQILARYGIKSPFVLYVGVAFPHKNLSGLLAAWEKFEKDYTLPHQLVLVGKKNSFYEQLLASDIWKKCQRVVYTDFVPDHELPALYQAAALYVMPSLYEGYALPALEACSYQLPIVSSQATCLPEVLGQAALYFDPQDPSAIAKAIYTGLTNQPLRENLIAEGVRLVTRYSAVELAKTTLNCYHKHSG